MKTTRRGVFGASVAAICGWFGWKAEASWLPKGRPVKSLTPEVAPWIDEPIIVRDDREEVLQQLKKRFEEFPDATFETHWLYSSYHVGVGHTPVLWRTWSTNLPPRCRPDVDSKGRVYTGHIVCVSGRLIPDPATRLEAFSWSDWS